MSPNKAEKFAQIEKNIYAKLVEAIDTTIYKTDSIEELKEFKGKLLRPSSIKEKNIHEITAQILTCISNSIYYSYHWHYFYYY